MFPYFDSEEGTTAPVQSFCCSYFPNRHNFSSQLMGICVEHVAEEIPVINDQIIIYTCGVLLLKILVKLQNISSDASTFSLEFFLQAEPLVGSSFLCWMSGLFRNSIALLLAYINASSISTRTYLLNISL